jgi:tetratricopeptide (TPR) repeat protein
MHVKAVAPEYQGALAALSVNTSLEEVLDTARRHQSAANDPVERARAALAVAERAWRLSYRSAREAQDAAGMAWALWSGGTLARQRGRFPFARRWLRLAASFAERGRDRVARGYALAGLAETGRVQGDFAGTLALHEQLLAEARAHGEPRHIVWALEGVAQIHRHDGDHDGALAMFTEALAIAEAADDQRGRAWALRGIADLTSVRGDPERALELLADAELTCREMRLDSALAYNHKMRGNVLYRAARHAEAERVYRDTIAEFTAIDERRGEALARLGLVKSRARQGAPTAGVRAELADLRARFTRDGLHHAVEMVDAARRDLVDSRDAPDWL